MNGVNVAFYPVPCHNCTTQYRTRGSVSSVKQYLGDITMVQITKEQYIDAEDQNFGVCENCDSVIEAYYDPDEEAGLCEVCDTREVHGVQDALLMGMINITE